MLQVTEILYFNFSDISMMKTSKAKVAVNEKEHQDNRTARS